MPAVARPCPVTRGRQVTRRGKSDPAPSCNNETMLLQSGSAVNASDVLWFYLRGILRGRCGNNSGTYPAAISACKYRISKIVGGARDNSDIGGVTAFRRNGITGGEGKQRFRSCLFHAGRSSALDVLPDQVPCKGCPGQLFFCCVPIGPLTYFPYVARPFHVSGRNTGEHHLSKGVENIPVRRQCHSSIERMAIGYNVNQKQTYVVKLGPAR